MNIGGIFLGFVTVMLWYHGINEFINRMSYLENAPDYDMWGQPKSLIKKRLKIMFAIQLIIGLLLIKWTFSVLGSDE
jgi:hypothetical protein